MHRYATMGDLRRGMKQPSEAETSFPLPVHHSRLSQLLSHRQPRLLPSPPRAVTATASPQLSGVKADVLHDWYAPAASRSRPMPIPAPSSPSHSHDDEEDVGVITAAETRGASSSKAGSGSKASYPHLLRFTHQHMATARSASSERQLDPELLDTLLRKARASLTPLEAVHRIHGATVGTQAADGALVNVRGSKLLVDAFPGAASSKRTLNLKNREVALSPRYGE